MAERKPYANVLLPDHLLNADKEALLAHIRFLTHDRQVQKKALNKARRRYKKAEKKWLVPEDPKPQATIKRPPPPPGPLPRQGTLMAPSYTKKEDLFDD